MPLVYITRKEHFNAAHRLYNPTWTDEKNKEVFGICANANYHGHNFELHVTVKGQPDKDTACVMDLKKLKILIQQQIISELDHKNLNIDVPWLQNIMPSIENIIVAIWNRLEPHIQGNAQLHKIQLWETNNNYVEYFGEIKGEW